MKLTNLLLSLSLPMVFVGCKTPTVQVTDLPPRDGPTTVSLPQIVGPTEPVGERASGPTGEDIPVMKDRLDWGVDTEIFKAQTVYFDLDQSTVNASELPKLDAVVAAMKTHPGKAVRISGHSDERGTEEYNRSLGARRALAVRETLGQLGLSPDLVDTVSFGEDRPEDPGHSAEAWARNRRGEIGMLTPPLHSAR